MLKLPMGWAQSAPIARKTGSTRRCFITMVLTNCRAASDVRRIVFTAMKRVITVQDVPGGGELRVPVGTIITPSAREVAAARGGVLTRIGEVLTQQPLPHGRGSVTHVES